MGNLAAEAAVVVEEGLTEVEGVAGEVMIDHTTRTAREYYSLRSFGGGILSPDLQR